MFTADLNSWLWLYFLFGTAFCSYWRFSLPFFPLVLVAYFTSSVMFKFPIQLPLSSFFLCVSLPETSSLWLESVLGGRSAYGSVLTLRSVVSWIPRLPLSSFIPSFCYSTCSSHLARKSMWKAQVLGAYVSKTLPSHRIGSLTGSGIPDWNISPAVWGVWF